MIASILIWALGHYPQHSASGNSQPDSMAILNQPDNQYHSTAEIPVSYQPSGTDQDAQSQSHGMEQSYLGMIGKFIEPAIKPLGFDWRMGVGLISGIAAKETIISTLGIIYHPEEGSTVTSGSLQERIRHLRKTDESINGAGIFTPLATLSFIAFILLYFPCIATIAVIGKESGSWHLALFTIVYTTALAWMVSFIIFQFGSFIMQIV